MAKPKPRAKIKPRTTLRQIEARSKASNRMKGRSVTNKFNSESIDNIRNRGSVRGSDVYQPDAGIDKKTGRGTMYTAGQYAKVREFDARIRRNSQITFAKGAATGGAIAGAGVAAGSYWTNKKNNDRNSK